MVGAWGLFPIHGDATFRAALVGKSGVGALQVGGLRRESLGWALLLPCRLELGATFVSVIYVANLPCFDGGLLCGQWIA